MPNGVSLHSHSEYEPPSLTINAKEKVGFFFFWGGGGEFKEKKKKFYPFVKFNLRFLILSIKTLHFSGIVKLCTCVSSAYLCYQLTNHMPKHHFFPQGFFSNKLKRIIT